MKLMNDITGNHISITGKDVYLSSGDILDRGPFQYQFQSLPCHILLLRLPFIYLKPKNASPCNWSLKVSLSHDRVEAPPPPPFHGGKGCYICSGAGVFLHMVDLKL